MCFFSTNSAPVGGDAALASAEAARQTVLCSTGIASKPSHRSSNRGDGRISSWS
jgi:hypothetical protein